VLHTRSLTRASFADTYLTTIGLAAHLGIFPWMYGNSRNAPPSNEDIARVAVAALMDPARHAGKSYRPTGPELLGAEDMAKAIGRAVGRSVRVVPTPTWLFMKTARMGGMPIDLMSNVRYYIDDQKRGAFEPGAPTTDVLEVTGRPQWTSRRSLVVMRLCPATSGLSSTGFATSCSS
jgi:NAD(P)H dehydrogenase (quinone)